LSYESRKNPQMTGMPLLITGFHTEDPPRRACYKLSSEPRGPSFFNQRDSISVVILTNRKSVLSSVNLRAFDLKAP